MDLIRENTPSTSEAKNLNTPANTADPKTPPWPASQHQTAPGIQMAPSKANMRLHCEK